MFVNENVNTKDAEQAKGFLFGHSRIVTAGLYINKFCKGAIQRKKGMTDSVIVEKFSAALKAASDNMKENTGYTIIHDGKHFVLALEDGAEDKASLFTGSQMKLNSLTEKELAAQADVLMEFDKQCDLAVEQYRNDIENYVPGEEIKNEETAEETVEETEVTEETAEETVEETEVTEETAEGTAEETAA